MGPPAQFDRLAKTDHPHRLPVFLPEKGNGPHGRRLPKGHFFHLLLCQIPADHRVDLLLHLLQLFGCHLPEVGKIKTEIIGVHQGPLLFHMGPQHFAQGMVKQVGGRMVAGRAPPLALMHHRRHRRPRICRQHLRDMHNQVVVLARVQHLHLLTVALQVSRVTYLSARLSIKRGLLQHHLEKISVFLVDTTVAGNPRGSHRFTVTREDHLVGPVHLHPVVGLLNRRIPRPFLLDLHLAVKTGRINSHPVLSGNELGQIKRKTIGIV